jgi:Multicopper oxidase
MYVFKRKNVIVYTIVLVMLAGALTPGNMIMSIYGKGNSGSSSSTDTDKGDQVEKPTLAQFISTSGSDPNGPSKMNSAQESVINYDISKNCANVNHLADTLNPTSYLTYFNCGHTVVDKNGTTTRHFSLIVREDKKIPITLGNPDTKTPPILWNAWTFNGSIPAPTMRMTAGDKVFVTVYNQGAMMHSLHMHSIHAGNVDGTMFSGPSGQIQPGHSFTYNFTAAPAGLWPYHCHMMPVALHINKGLYGHMIIDPPADKARPHMKEMNMIMDGFSLNMQPSEEVPRLPTHQEASQIMNGNDSVGLPEEFDNHIYALNGVAFYYDKNPIQLKVDQPYRVYLTNFLDFDFSNTFHLHGQVFQYYPSGTSMNPMMINDIISLPQGDRGIMEFTYHLPGIYMIHSHFESQAGRGWEGLLHVSASGNNDDGNNGTASVTPVGTAIATNTSSSSSPSTGNNNSQSNNSGGSSSSSNNNNDHKSSSSNSNSNHNDKSSGSSSSSSNNNNDNNGNDNKSSSNNNNNNSNNNDNHKSSSSNNNNNHNSSNNNNHKSSGGSNSHDNHKGSHSSSSHSSSNTGSGNNSNVSSQSNNK